MERGALRGRACLKLLLRDGLLFFDGCLVAHEHALGHGALAEVQREAARRAHALCDAKEQTFDSTYQHPLLALGLAHAPVEEAEDGEAVLFAGQRDRQRLGRHRHCEAGEPRGQAAKGGRLPDAELAFCSQGLFLAVVAFGSV